MLTRHSIVEMADVFFNIYGELNVEISKSLFSYTIQA